MNTGFTGSKLRCLTFACAFVFIAAAGARGADQKAGSPQPAARIVFFTPSDVKVPDGVRPRLSRAAESCEKFYFDWMKHWGYPPGVTTLFRREADGMVEVLQIHGDEPVARAKDNGSTSLQDFKPGFPQDVVKRASAQYHITGEGNVWWIFVFLGDPPARFSEFAGAGNPRDGGWAIVNYDSSPGELRPDLALAEGFNGKFFLKGTIHELGHAFGLPHVGPDPALNLGNTLMGPATDIYLKRVTNGTGRSYLCESSAAMLWKHPVFSGTNQDVRILPNVELRDYKAVFDATSDVATLSGKLVSDIPAHSVIIFDDLGKPKQEY